MRFWLCAAAATGAVASAWFQAKGMNACNTPTKQGPCAVPQDAPGFHFVGSLDNSSLCEASCVDDSGSADPCSIWLYSDSSRHCWWRLDAVWDPVEQGTITSGCLQEATSARPCIPGCGACPAAPTPAPPPTSPPTPLVPSTLPNMNGEYLLSHTPKSNDTDKLFPKQYNKYPGGVYSFDVYSPLVSTLYSQVFWKGLPAVDLPADIVQHFKGKAMAVVGFELDQVMRTSEGDVSVPITVSYNHHFESTMTGAAASLDYVPFSGPADVKRSAMMAAGAAEGTGGHGLPSEGAWVVKGPKSVDGIPTSQAFGAANGGEVRKSFHGYAPGYVQLIHSPEKFQITPMQIDTWNRDKMNATEPHFVPGPLPRSSLAPENASYSGLLECPVTTRIQKMVDSNYVAINDKTCGPDALTTASECFAAAESIVPASNYTVSEVTDSMLPSGCTATGDAQGIVSVVFNKASSSVNCAEGATLFGGVQQSLVGVTIALDQKAGTVQLTLSGPADVWFGVGFNASAMKEAPWAVVVEATGPDATVSERKLQDQNPGTVLAASVTVVSSQVVDGRRVVVLTRPAKGKTADHYTFDASAGAIIPFINAIGASDTISYHHDKTPSAIALFPLNGVGACVCALLPPVFGDATGTLVYVATPQPEDTGSGEIPFDNKCAAWPRVDLLPQHNPACDLRTYVGGQIACHHMFSLLDADQEIPWPEQPLEFHLKFRFWVQDYDAGYHKAVRRVTWGLASPVEYDVPKCKQGVTGCSQLADGTWVHTIRGTFQGEGSLVAAHFHCHAPTCLRFAMYRCAGGTQLCNETNGELLCAEHPIYGGTGQIDDPRFDEAGFILQPPCLWGDPEFGLEPPPSVEGYVLGSVKLANATNAHHGEMAWQQMLLV